MLDIEEIIKATKGKLLNKTNDKIKSYSITSNEIKENCFFIPLKGEKTDGHNYILSAVENGAIGFFIADNNKDKEQILTKAVKINKNINIVEVKDTYEALEKIAMYNSSKYPDTIKIGITGSVGKTSTREMLASILKEKYTILKTIKNYNSEIGIPLMLLMNQGQEIAIYEMGMDGIGQLNHITNMVKPNIAVITNIGTSHIGILGSRENIFKAKMEVTNGITKGGMLFVNGDDAYLKKVEMNDKYTTIKYKVEKNPNLKIIDILADSSKFIYKDVEYIINEPGKHNIYNAIVAIEIGKKLSLSEDQIKKGIYNYRNFNQRLEQTVIGDNILIIDDSYNASLDSMKSGLEAINNIKGRRKIIVLGDMLELGYFSAQLHKELAKAVQNTQYDKIFLYGKEIKITADAIKQKENVAYTNNISELEKMLKSEIKAGDLIYFKASNGMKLYNVIQNIKNEY